MSILYKFITVLLCFCAVLLSGCYKKSEIDDLKLLRLMLEVRGVNYGSLGSQVVVMPDSGAKISLQRDPLVSEFEVINVELVRVDLGLALLLQVSEPAARNLYRASVANHGGRVVLMVNGNPIGARRLDGALSEGQYYTFVELPDAELPQLVLDLKRSIAEIQAAK